jgi:hypothetical protein
MPDNIDMLRDAAARNLAAVLSLPSAGMLRHHKSRFLGELHGGFLMEAPANEGPLIDALIIDKQPCGVSFRNGVYKVMFASPLRQIQRGWQLGSGTLVDALLLETPSQIKSMQRRSNYRVEIPNDSGLAIRVWRIGDRAYIKEQPMSAQEIKTELRDISTGGVGVRFIGKDGELPKITPDDRLRIQLAVRDLKLIIEGRMRPPTKPPENGIVITGIHFKKLENDLEGRQTAAQLTRIVGELQREEIRRTRLGLAKSA